MASLPLSTRRKLRKLIIGLILATDMKMHFSIIERFSALHEATREGMAAKLDSAGAGRAPEETDRMPPVDIAQVT
jgi:hypothetical protein